MFEASSVDNIRFEEDFDYEEDISIEDEDVDEIPELFNHEDNMDVNGWGGVPHYRPHTPKAKIRPQMSPRRYPRPISHIAPPSSLLLPPPSNAYDQGSSSYSSIYSSDDGLGVTKRPAGMSVTLGTVDANTKPYFQRRGRGRITSRVLGQPLSRSPRDLKIDEEN